MNSNNSCVLNVPTSLLHAANDCGDSNQMLLDNFIFAHMYSADIQIDAKAQSRVRRAAFALIDDKHYELHNKRISNSILLYRDNADTADKPASAALETNVCCHHYVADAERVIECLKSLENTLDYTTRGNVLIFYPYLKQLCAALDVLKKTFGCCAGAIAAMQAYVNNVISHCLLCVEKLKLLTKTIHAMSVFMVDDVVIYECNICKEMSTDERFLKPKECCDFAVCNGCCVKMWKVASTHAKCPACRTSFKSLN